MSMLAAAARTARKTSLMLPCRSSLNSNNHNNSNIVVTLSIQVRWMHPEQRLIEKRKIALAAAHQQVAELEAKLAAAEAAARPLQEASTSTKLTVQVSSALPKLNKNDGTSSGAVVERRLREKRQAILDKMMLQEASSPNLQHSL
jgi:hypothetical protein